MEPSERRGRAPRIARFGSLVPLAGVWSAGVLVLVVTLAKHSSDDARLLLDPAAVAGLPWYTGLISNLGILGWTLATAAAGGAAHIATLGNRLGAARMLRQAAILSLLLTLDDLFQLHSSVFPRMFGVSKATVILVYGSFAFLWLAGNIREILRTRWGLLVAAGCAIAVSVSADRVVEGTGWGLIAEDGSKFLAVLAWSSYFTITARDISTSVVRELSSKSAEDSPRPERLHAA